MYVARQFPRLLQRREVAADRHFGPPGDVEYTLYCRHQHSLSFISASMSSKSGLCRSRSELRRLKALFFAVRCSPHPRIATSTTEKKTDDDNHH
jgi:hypothetical protein